MLVNPLINDQMVIAEQIEHLNIGKRLDLKDASPMTSGQPFLLF